MSALFSDGLYASLPLQKAFQLAKARQDTDVRRALQGFAAVRARCHAYPARTGMGGHFEIEGGIADDDALRRHQTQLVAQPPYHIGRGLGWAFGRAVSCPPKIPRPGLGYGLIQTAAPLARGHRQPIPRLPQAFEGGQHVGKQPHMAVVRIQIMGGISFHQFFMLAHARRRGKLLHHLHQAAAD